MTMPNNFPNDITTQILLELPDESVERFKSVCKSWCSLIEDRQFIKQRYYYEIFLHLWRDRYSSTDSPLIEDPPRILHSSSTRFLNSCNGSILLAFPYSSDTIVLWNPDLKKAYSFHYQTGTTRQVTIGEGMYLVKPLWRKWHIQKFSTTKDFDLEVSCMKKNEMSGSTSWSKMLEITTEPGPGVAFLKKGAGKKGAGKKGGGDMLYFRWDINEYVVYDSKTQEFNEFKVDGREASRKLDEYIIEKPALLFVDRTYLDRL